ncbi:MAG TPA: hypothetical protein VK701_02290, partial [Solirubrobacteraceae bacterium]|nr:hypothetical protein [Solirubrobacteraceae bacterium]
LSSASRTPRSISSGGYFLALGMPEGSPSPRTKPRIRAPVKTGPAQTPYPLETMRDKWPHTFAYLKRFEAQLKQRSGYRRYFKPTDPFYAIYNVSLDTVASTKVAWRTMGSDMQCT